MRSAISCPTAGRASVRRTFTPSVFDRATARPMPAYGPARTLTKEGVSLVTTPVGLSCAARQATSARGNRGDSTLQSWVRRGVDPKWIRFPYRPPGRSHGDHLPSCPEPRWGWCPSPAGLVMRPSDERCAQTAYHAQCDRRVSDDCNSTCEPKTPTRWAANARPTGNRQISRKASWAVAVVPDSNSTEVRRKAHAQER